jgi:hypothetical protein
MYGLIYKILLELPGRAVNQERVDSRNFGIRGFKLFSEYGVFERCKPKYCNFDGQSVAR